MFYVEGKTLLIPWIVCCISAMGNAHSRVVVRICLEQQRDLKKTQQNTTQKLYITWYLYMVLIIRKNLSVSCLVWTVLKMKSLQQQSMQTKSWKENVGYYESSKILSVYRLHLLQNGFTNWKYLLILSRTKNIFVVLLWDQQMSLTCTLFFFSLALAVLFISTNTTTGY